MADKTSLVEAENQEKEYWFPYHYITQYGAAGFSQFYNDSWGISYVSTIELILDELKGLSPEAVVDIGCGDGRLTREINIDLSPGRLVGVDYSSRAVSLAKAMNQDFENIEFYSEDITNSEGRLGRFDTAVLMEVFEHIPLELAKGFMESVHSLIKPGGSLLLTVPHSNKPVEYKHFQHFSINEILEYLKSDFEIVKVVPFERSGIRRRILTALLSNKFFILSNKAMLNFLYTWYKRHLFHCNHEKRCQRIFVHARAK